MPSVMENPTVEPSYRTSGSTPYPTKSTPMPAGIQPRQVTLRDGRTATLMSFNASSRPPLSLLAYINTLCNREIEAGDTYPMNETMTVEAFTKYWFGVFAAIMILGNKHEVEQLLAKARSTSNHIESGPTGVAGPSESPEKEAFWEHRCLGTFYIKPNYPGRSSHVSNGGFLVGPAARGKGVGRLMGEGYLDYAPKLGFTYSVFNLVYETNVASCRIWDALDFERIGRVKGCGNLRSYPGRLIDAIQYGKELR